MASEKLLFEEAEHRLRLTFRPNAKTKIERGRIARFTP
jgi:hypothetical protein